MIENDEEKRNMFRAIQAFREQYRSHEHLFAYVGYCRLEGRKFCIRVGIHTEQNLYGGTLLVVHSTDLPPPEGLPTTFQSYPVKYVRSNRNFVFTGSIM
jgi:hypothetical protein